MFTTLLESRAVPQRRTASSIASVVIHSAIITGGVMATAREVVTVAPQDPVMHVVEFTRPKPVTTQAPRRLTTAVAGSPSVQRIVVPQIVPVGLPAFDFMVEPLQADRGIGPMATAGVICLRDCGGAPATDGTNALWSGNDVMMRLRDAPVPPRYPEALRRAGVEGDVVVKFEVDTTGVIDMRSIEVLESTHEAFTTSVRETLARLRFTPSMIGERRVRALAVMPFRFTLR